MTDIVERLRVRAVNARYNPTGLGQLSDTIFDDAADEIERLRAAIDTSIGDLLREDMDNAYVVLWRSRQPLPSPPTQTIE